MNAEREATTWASIVIERVEPEIDAGRHPIKREVGDRLEITADIFKEGHDELTCVLRYRAHKDEVWQETPMRAVGNDRWSGYFDLTENTRYRYTIGAYVNLYASWRQEITKKHEAGEDIASELLEGRALVAGTARLATRRDGERI